MAEKILSEYTIEHPKSGREVNQLIVSRIDAILLCIELYTPQNFGLYFALLTKPRCMGIAAMIQFQKETITFPFH